MAGPTTKAGLTAINMLFKAKMYQIEPVRDKHKKIRA